VFVVAGFNDDLKSKKVKNTEIMINQDLNKTHLVLLIVNFVVFLLLTVCVDEVLYRRITKPMVKLHHDITDKKELKR
jgi:hypothetical protein